VPFLDFTWEVANNANIGLEGAILNNKVTFEFDVFNNQRKQMLIVRSGSTPQSSGISNILPPVNEGHLENKGWEARVGYNGKIGDLTFNVSVTGMKTQMFLIIKRPLVMPSALMARPFLPFNMMVCSKMKKTWQQTRSTTARPKATYAPET
jgi:hypothetical protein